MRTNLDCFIVHDSFLLKKTILSFLTVNSVDKNGNAVGGLEQLGTSAGKAVGQLKKMFNTVSNGYNSFKDLDESIRGSGTSFSDYIRYTSESEDRPSVLIFQCCRSILSMHFAVFIGKPVESHPRQCYTGLIQIFEKRKIQ